MLFCVFRLKTTLRCNVLTKKHYISIPSNISIIRTNFSIFFQRFSNNSKLAFTNEEIMTIYLSRVMDRFESIKKIH